MFNCLQTIELLSYYCLVIIQCLLVDMIDISLTFINVFFLHQLRNYI